MNRDSLVDLMGTQGLLWWIVLLNRETKEEDSEHMAILMKVYCRDNKEHDYLGM